MPCVKFVETAKETFMSNYSFLNKLHPRLGTVAKIWSSRKATRRLIEDLPVRTFDIERKLSIKSCTKVLR